MHPYPNRGENDLLLEEELIHAVAATAFVLHNLHTSYKLVVLCGVESLTKDDRFYLSVHLTQKAATIHAAYLLQVWQVAFVKHNTNWFRFFLHTSILHQKTPQCKGFVGTFSLTSLILYHKFRLLLIGFYDIILLLCAHTL